MSASMDVAGLVGREQVGGDAPRVDPLLLYFGDRAGARYVDPATGSRLRSRTIDDHAYALRQLVNAPSLQQILAPEMFQSPVAHVCGVNQADVSGMTIAAGVKLLTDPVTPARFVSVVDGGYLYYGDLPYDSHSSHLEYQSKNVHHALTTLAANINTVGENDPAKLNLDDTMVLICSEFGRTPYLQDTTGTNHFPYGYVNVLIGGPVQAGITGAIGPDGYAVSYVTPSEVRAGLLAGLGIYPFSPESFAVGDLQSQSNELDALAWLHQQVLGRSS
jgi:hypothetical protein